jgi:hypothetical protein
VERARAYFAATPQLQNHIAVQVKPIQMIGAERFPPILDRIISGQPS